MQFILSFFLVFIPALICSGQTSLSKSDSLFELSKELLYKSEINESVIAAKQLIECCIDHKGRYIDAKIVIATAYRFAGRHDEALIQFKKADSFYMLNFDELDYRSLNLRIENLRLFLSQYKTQEAIQQMNKIDSLVRFIPPDDEQAKIILNLRASISYQLEEWDLALDMFHELLEIIDTPRDFNDSIQVLNAVNDIGNIFFFRGQYFAALEQYRLALKLTEALYGIESIPAAQALFNVGLIHSILGYYNDAENALRSSLELRLRFQGEQGSTVAEIYKEFALNYLEQGDFDQALNYFLKAIEIREALNFQSDPVLVNTYVETASTFMRVSKPEMAARYLQKAEQLLRFTHGDYQHASFHRSAANVYLETEEWDKAFEHLKRTYNYFKSQAGNELVLADVFVQFARIESAKGNFAQAEQWLLKAINNSQAFGQFQPVFLEASVNLMSLLVKQRRFKEASVVFNAFFERYSILSQDEWDYFIPYPEFYLQALAYRVKTDHYLGDQNVSIKEFIETGFQVIALSRNQSVFDATQLKWLANARLFYDEVVQLAYYKYCSSADDDWLLMAFDASEAAKSIRLLNHIKAREAHQHFGIPETLYQKEQDLKFRLGEADLFFKEMAASTDFDSPGLLQQIAFENHALSDSLRSLQNIIRTNYPEYYQLVYGGSRVKLRDIQQNLKPGELILKYYVSDGNVFAFAVNKHEVYFEQLGASDILRDQVRELRNQLVSFAAYENLVLNLSSKLVNPFTGILLHTEKLIIIPDDLLFYLPFDILKLQPENQDYAESLFNRLPISYQHNATLWAMFLNESKNRYSKLAAFAPWFEDFDQLSMRDGNETFWLPLKYALSESMFAAGLFRGNVYSEEKATRQAFLTSLGQYNMIHVATHANFNDENPGLSQLIFRCEEIFGYCVDPIMANDIFHLRTDAGLVVLSACNTGIGRLYHGDGISSLATAFQYAGAQNVVLSLWPVPDLSTSIFMEYFYKSLHGGKSVEKALHQAKVSLAAHGPAFEHPIHWAGFQVYGASHIAFNVEVANWYQNKLWQLILSIGLIVLFGIGYKFRQRKKGRTDS